MMEQWMDENIANRVIGAVIDELKSKVAEYESYKLNFVPSVLYQVQN
jgi:hypothetical protein